MEQGQQMFSPGGGGVASAGVLLWPAPVCEGGVSGVARGGVDR